jgi:hypothetical protein
MVERTVPVPDRGRCEWPGCTYSGRLNGVHRRWVCAEHEPAAICEIVRAGPRGPVDENGVPTDSRWLNSFSRLINAMVLAKGNQGGLTKGKVEGRTSAFCIELPCVTFWIERHPARGVTKERWAFNVETSEFHRTAERVIDSIFLDPQTGRLRCPECQSSSLDVTPGRVRCLNCRFEVLHEHSIH